MGLRKDLHIKAITEIPEVKERWHSVYGKYPDQGEKITRVPPFSRDLTIPHLDTC